MALLFADGFDHVDDDYGSLLKWDSYLYASDPEYLAGQGRTGGWGFAVDGVAGARGVQKSLSDNYGTLIFGAAFKVVESLGYDTDEWLWFRDSSSVQIEIRILQDGSIAVYRGESILLGKTSPGLVSLDNWFYFEAKIVFHGSTGSVEFKVNEVQVLNLTSQNTINTANAYCNNFWLRSSGGAFVHVDDLYLCDTSGSLNNDFLGDIQITTLYPTSDGNSSDFTPSTGVDNYATVDDPQLTAATDYNESSTISDKDLYGVTTYNGTGTIHAVQINAAVLNTDVGSMNIRTLCRSGGTLQDNEGSDFAISQSIKAAMTIHEQEPTDSVAWTASKINASEFGLKIQS